MKIAIGSDHRGFQLKEKLLTMLSSKGHEITDCGANGSESVDYPDFASQVAQAVGNGTADRGILICGTGIGMAIAANKYKGVRAAPCTDEVTAELSRRHNDANVVCLSGDMLSLRSAERIVEVWLTTDFEAGRHSRRVEKIGDIEAQQGCR